MSAPPPVVSPELRVLMRRLKLGRLLDTLPERLALARTHELGHGEFLEQLFSDEVQRRDADSAGLRARAARLDPLMTLESWDETAKVTYDRAVLEELVSMRFVEQARNAFVLGPVGVGKTFLASALGHLACRAGFHVRFHRADALLRMLRQSRMDNSREALLSELCSIDLLVIDDFALEPMTRDESRDVYQLFVERNTRASTIVTSNRDTAEWLAVFDDTLLAQSAVDRFRNSAYDLVIDGESYRSRLKPTLPAETPISASPVHKRPTGRRRNLVT